MPREDGSQVDSIGPAQFGAEPVDLGQVFGMETHPSLDVDAEEDAEIAVVGGAITVVGGADAGKLFLLGPNDRVLGRGDDADLSFADITVSRAHARLDLREGAFSIDDLGSHNGTFVDGARVEGSRPLPPVCRIRLGRGTLLQFLAVDEAQAAALKQITDSLVLDRVTGTGNRAFLDRRLGEELSFAQRHRSELGVLLLDLDHFKLVNDQLGHPAGDRLLRLVGTILKDTVRLEDAVFRYGGDEFCIVVRGIDSPGLLRIAERVRVAITDQLARADETFAKVTISVGIAALDHGEVGTEPFAASALIERADAALYRAKESGRDRVVLWPGEAS